MSTPIGRPLRFDETGVMFRYKGYRRDGADRRQGMMISTDEVSRRRATSPPVDRPSSTPAAMPAARPGAWRPQNRPPLPRSTWSSIRSLPMFCSLGNEDYDEDDVYSQRLRAMARQDFSGRTFIVRSDESEVASLSSPA